MAKNRKIKKKKKHLPRKEISQSRRKFLGIGAGALLAVSVPFGLWAYFSNRDVDNQTRLDFDDRVSEARRNPEIRQVYLNELLNGREIPYCSGVVYDPEGIKIIGYIKSELEELGSAYSSEKLIKPWEERFRNGNFDAKTPDVFDLSGKGRKSKIFLGRRLFEEEFRTSEDIKHIIIAHEGHHVLQHAKGLEYMKSKDIVYGINNKSLDHLLVREVIELDANYHGLKRIFSGEFDVSESYREETIEVYNTQKRRIKSVINRSSDLQRKLITTALEATKDL